ncbi:MAG: hypothetical protein AB7K71_15705 [Polyangiaceae bacterium]
MVFARGQAVWFKGEFAYVMSYDPARISLVLRQASGRSIEVRRISLQDLQREIRVATAQEVSVAETMLS